MDKEKIIIKPIRDIEETDKSKLTELLKTVAESRQDVELAKRERDSAGEALKETAEGKHFQSCADHLMKEQETLIQGETELKSAVLEVYKETKEKEPIDKVKVKIFTNLEYDDAEVLEWCKTNATALLKVDTKTFEKTAVKMNAPVTEKDDPKCTIAKDLSLYLDSATDPAEASECPPSAGSGLTPYPSEK